MKYLDHIKSIRGGSILGGFKSYVTGLYDPFSDVGLRLGLGSGLGSKLWLRLELRRGSKYFGGPNIT